MKSFQVYKHRPSSRLFPQTCDGTIKRYDIQNGRYFFLRENEDTDIWELFVKNI